MRIRERHMNGAAIDWDLPDGNSWDIAGVIEKWRDYNTGLLVMVNGFESAEDEADAEPAKQPMGFTIVETGSETVVDE